MNFSEIWPKIDSIFGWLSEDEARKLFDLAGAMREGESAVELGAFMGRSSAAIAYGILGGPHSTNTVVSIDTWVGTKGAEEEALHEQILREHGVTDMFELHYQNMHARNLHPWSRRLRGTTVPYGVEWAREWSIAVGLLFIDADHRYEAVKADFDGWAPLVTVGGFVAFHDSWAPGPTRVIAEMPQNFSRIGGAGDLAVFQKDR